MAKDDVVNDKEVKLKNTHVPDKVYAYSLQIRHMMYELLKCTSNNDIVSVEVFEDVGMQSDNGEKEAVQLKSALSNRNPVANRAKDLWKTMYNWLLAVQEEELEVEKTKFIMFITVNKQGEIVNSFNKANDKKSSIIAWESARNEFYDERGQEKGIKDDYALYIRSFFNSDNKEKVCKIIEKFSLKTIEESHTNFLYKEFKKHIYIADNLMGHVFDNVLGWIDKKTAIQIEQGKAMAVEYKEFRNQLILVSKEINQNQSLVELATKPTNEEIKREFDLLRTYVEQLNIIDCEYDEKIEAISDFLRASTNRTIWAQNADVSDESIIDYGEELKRLWKSEKKILGIQHRDLTSEVLGTLIYNSCIKNNPNIGCLRVPAFFSRGCYHSLADDEVIGWHPEYGKELKKRRNDNGK